MSDLERNTTKSLIPSIKDQRALFAPEILKVDASDNVYFHIFNSRQKADWFYNRVIKSKCVNIIMCVIGVFSTIVSIVINLFLPEYRAIVYKSYAAYIEWVFILYAIMHIMGFNIDLLKAITKTFECIYRAMQIVVILIIQPFIVSATAQMAGSYTMFDVARFEIVVVVAFSFSLYFDAWFMKKKTKLILMFIFNVCIAVTPFYVYFNIEDVIWDPFNASFGEKVTTISLKSIVLNALTNLIIVNSKAVITGIQSYVTDRTLISKGCVKSVSLVNRPFVQWKKYNDNNVTGDCVASTTPDTTQQQQMSAYDDSLEQETVKEIRCKPYNNEGKRHDDSDGSVSLSIVHDDSAS